MSLRRQQLVGAMVRRSRKAAGLSMGCVADFLRTTVVRISDIERGITRASTAELAALEELFTAHTRQFVLPD